MVYAIAITTAHVLGFKTYIRDQRATPSEKRWISYIIRKTHTLH